MKNLNGWNLYLWFVYKKTLLVEQNSWLCDMWINCFLNQILLNKWKLKQTKVIFSCYSLLLLTNYKDIWLELSQFPNTFSYLPQSYGVANLEDIPSIISRKYAKYPINVMLKKENVLLRTCKHETFL